MTLMETSQMAATDATRSLRADARRNRQAILSAASRLFAEQGLEAQMPDVAKLAGVGVGTVYRHYPTKDDLIAALVGEGFERLAEQARECLQLEDPWTGISEFIRFSAEIQAGDRGLCDIVGLRADITGAAAEAAGMPELLDQLVKRAQRDGSLRHDLSWEDVPMISCGLGSAIRQQVGPATGRWPRLVEIIIDGLRAPGSSRLPRAAPPEQL